MEPTACDPDLRQLTVGLSRGDDAAWARFHRDYGPALFRQLLAGAWGDHDLASEALQLTYLRIARHARPCDQAAVFNGWLRVVARSVLFDCLRKRKTLRHHFPSGDAESATVPIETEEEHRLDRALDAALAELDPDERALLEGKYYRGESVRELAAELQLSEKALESRLTRARAGLREKLQRSLARHE